MQPRHSVRVVFDETHSESWTSSAELAQRINPDNASNTSCARAARALASRDFVLSRHTTGPLDVAALTACDILVLFHPCDPQWERTTGGSPTLGAEEIQAICSFVAGGGGLLVVTEHENAKYGNNLNALLEHFHIQLDPNGTVADDRHAVAGTHTWITLDVANGLPEVMEGIREVAVYRAGFCKVGNGAMAALRSFASSRPKAACLVATARHSRGRVAVVTDSDVFGDECVGNHDNLRLWLNLFYFLSVRSDAGAEPDSAAAAAARRPAMPEAWPRVKELVDRLRPLHDHRRAPDGPATGRIDGAPQREAAGAIVDELVPSLQALGQELPHQADYFTAVVEDFGRWRTASWPVPDFARSLARLHPEHSRPDGLQYACVAPMYTQNASKDVRCEAVLFTINWPAWLAEIEATRELDNPAFVPALFVDHTQGYVSECAVLFPEQVSVERTKGKARPPGAFGAIFCDREAARFRRVVLRAVERLQINVLPDLAYFLQQPELVTDAFAAWDLIHDRCHPKGPMPLAEYMERHPQPYWNYGLEELRVDLRTYDISLELEKKDFPFARYIRWCILFDRIIRFPITGPRDRNFDSLAGQILFSWLYGRKAIDLEEGRLLVRWNELDAAFRGLLDKMDELYRFGPTQPEHVSWAKRHDFIASQLDPNPASRWPKDGRLPETSVEVLKLVHPDEFPLSNFYDLLKRKMA